MKALLAGVLLLPLSAAAQTPAAKVRPIDLGEAYRLSLARSEQIAASGATYEQTEAQVRELWSNVLPHVSLMGQEVLQDVPKGQSGLFLQPNRETGWFNLHQPLFAGMRDFLAIRAAKDTRRSAELQLERAKHLLYQDVARAYLDLLQAQDQIRIRELQAEIDRDRIKELKEFRRVGRSRPSELLAAESQLAQDLAQLETSRETEQLAQFRLGFLTGLDERLEPRDVPALGPAPDLNAAMDLARKRPDVEARRVEYDAGQASVRGAQLARMPVISLDANYYFKQPPSFTQDVKWTATILGSLPLYMGGGISANVAENKALLEVRKQNLSLATRTAELEARSAHRDLLSSATVVGALENAARLAEQNAKAQGEDYRLGQVTNIEVLGALSALQQTRLAYSAARLDAYWARVRLQVAAGRPGAEL